MNDQPEELSGIARFIADELDADTPWHISRFFPAYRMTDRQPTSVETLNLTRQIGADAGLKYVYVGNLQSARWEDTRCPDCNIELIRRRGYVIQDNRVVDGHCPNCGSPIAGRDLDWRRSTSRRAK